MLFTSFSFLFYFLPITILGHYVIKGSLQNYWLLLMSLVFYTWGEPSFLPFIFAHSLVIYLCGIYFEQRSKDSLGSKIVLCASSAWLFGVLFFYKYLDFGLSIVTQNRPEWVQSIILPLGISFFTFQAASYLFDVYRGSYQAHRRYSDVLLYLILFPQLIAGPIVLFSDIQEDIGRLRSFSVMKFQQGLVRFFIGLGKKAILANTFALMADTILNSQGLSGYEVMVGVGLYTLQIFLDFSGYSDMAIGIGSMLGFSFPENFNLPYISRSVQEFWQRWHITLGGWFREYIYIPLGGSKKGYYRTLLNIMVVFLFTGIWHGANYTFLLWGVYNGLAIIIERLFLKKFLSSIPRVFSHVYLMVMVFYGWLLFRADSLTQASDWVKALAVWDGVDLQSSLIQSVFNNERLVLVVLGVLFASGVMHWCKDLFKKYTPSEIYLGTAQLAATITFIGSLLYLLTSTYNPFIYFRF